MSTTGIAIVDSRTSTASVIITTASGTRRERYAPTPTATSASATGSDKSMLIP